MSNKFAFTRDELRAGRISHCRLKQLLLARCTFVYRVEHWIETDADHAQVIVVARVRVGACGSAGDGVWSAGHGPQRLLQLWCIGDGLGSWRWCPAPSAAVAGLECLPKCDVLGRLMPGASM